MHNEEEKNQENFKRITRSMTLIIITKKVYFSYFMDLIIHIICFLWSYFLLKL